MSIIMFEAFITRFFILVCHYIWHQLKISPPIFYVSIYLTEMHFSSTTPWDLLSPNLSLEGGLSYKEKIGCHLEKAISIKTYVGLFAGLFALFAGAGTGCRRGLRKSMHRW